MRETVEIVRRVIRGERRDLSRDRLRTTSAGGEGKALRSAAQARPDIPMYLATFSREASSLLARWPMAGSAPRSCPEHADVFLRSPRGGCRARWTIDGELDLHAGGIVAFGDDLASLIARRKPGLAFSLGAMGSRQNNFYNDAYQRAGLRGYRC